MERQRSTRQALRKVASVPADEVSTSSHAGAPNRGPPLTEIATSARFVAECDLPTRTGNFRLRAYRGWENSEPTAVVTGDVSGENVLVRVHDQCFTSEVLGSMRCDCKEQLEQSFALLRAEGRGVIIYLQQEGRGIGLANKIAAYALQDGGLDTVEANHKLGFLDELRTYDSVPEILKDLGTTSVRLLTNNPYKVESLRRLGVDVVERLPLLVPPTKENRAYMRTKAQRMAHILPEETAELLLDSTEPSAADGASSLSSGSGEAATEAEAAKTTETEETFVNPATGRTHRWSKFGRASVEAAIAAVGRGEVVCVTDDEARENEGDLIAAAELVSAETMAFVVRHTGGVICAALPAARLEALQLPQMVSLNEDPKETAFTVTVDANVGTTTGISARDRAATMRLLADPTSSPDLFCRPGHVFPLRAQEGGVLTRDGHTEATVDLCRLAGLQPCGLLSEIVTADSLDMARMPEIIEFSRKHNLVLTTIEDMICYRLAEGL